MNYGDWLGTGTIADQFKEYKTFDQAREYVQKLGLKNQKEWFAYSKSGIKPIDIPAAPNMTYKKKGWTNWYDWLGKNK